MVLRHKFYKYLSLYFASMTIRQLLVVSVMIEEPNLRGNILAGSDVEEFHALPVSSIKALLGHFVDYFTLLKTTSYYFDINRAQYPDLGVGPLLVPALAVAVGHLDLLPGGGEGVGHHGAAVLPPQLKLPGEREKLGRGHEVVTHVLAQVVAEIVSDYRPQIKSKPG